MRCLLVFACVLAAVVVWVVTFAFVARCVLDELTDTMSEEQAPAYFPAEAHAIVARKRRDGADGHAVTMLWKMAVTPCYRGIPRWSTLERVLRDEVERLPRNLDCIVGVTSGGWLLGLMLAEIMQKPCYQLRYTRYADKTRMASKAKAYFKGKREALRPPDWTNAEHNVVLSGATQDMLVGQRVLLVDDTIGSGGTMRVCKSFLVGCGARTVLTFVMCSLRDTGLADYAFTNRHFLMFPWGLDV